MTLDWGLRAEDGRRPSIADKATVDWAVLKMRRQSRDSVIRVREREFPSTRAMIEYLPGLAAVVNPKIGRRQQ